MAAASTTGAPVYYPALQGCRSVENYECLNRIDEGTYGVVYRARDLATGELVALKRLKLEKEREGFPITALREISTLITAPHPHIVNVREIVVGSTMERVYIVFDYVEHELRTLLERHAQPFSQGEIKTLLRQLLSAVAHLHDNWIIHRDLKTSNLLLNNRGMLKVADFGMAREYGSPRHPMTELVVTLWYRAPELLLGAKEYTTAVDVWSVGCIFGELILHEPLFPGAGEIDQISRIFRDLGTPDDTVWPGFSQLPHVRSTSLAFVRHERQIRRRFMTRLTANGVDLLERMLTYDPQQRITAAEALQHPYFDETPRPVSPSMFPTWPPTAEGRRDRHNSPQAPARGRDAASEGGLFSLDPHAASEALHGAAASHK